MKRMVRTSLAMAMLWAGLYVLACGLTAWASGQGPGQMLAALYVAASGLLSASWAAGVAAPVGARHG